MTSEARDVDIHLVAPDGPGRWAAARSLVEEYGRSLGVDLGFQDFEREVNDLPHEYGPPLGAFLLAERDGVAIACVGLRPLAADACEMKRLYVVPAARGSGLGRRLAEAIVAEGRRLGYRRMRLDTLVFMTEAQALYRTLGFRPAPAYRFNPVPGTSFLELEL